MNQQGVTRQVQRIAFRLKTVGAIAALAWGLIALGALLLAAVWLDLLFDLPANARRAAPWLAAALAGTAVLWLVVRHWRSCREPDVARLLDRVGQTGGMVLSGWELERQARAGTVPPATLSAGFAQVAILRAEERARGVPSQAAAPLKPVKCSWSALVGFAALLGLAVLVAPGLARTQWLRFLHPGDDVPPFTRLEFVVTPGDASVLYGDSLDVYAEVRGEPANEVELVLARTGGEEALPMFQEADGRWRCMLAKLTEPAEYHVRSLRSRSRRHAIAIITVPKILNVRVEVTPPAYAQGIGYYRGNLPLAGVSGLPGAKVRVWATSNRPLAGGKLVVSHAEQTSEHPMRPAPEDSAANLTSAGSPEEAVGSFIITASGKFEVQVRDRDGQSSRESVTATIALLADERPFVRLLQPRQVSLATPSASLPVELAGEDDYGISRLQLYRNLNDSRSLPQNISLGDQPPRRRNETVYLPLANYGLSPGDQIKVFARVEDNDPAGAKGAESPIAVVHIISQQEFERMLRAREGLDVLLSKYRQAQRMLESLRENSGRLREKTKDKPGLLEKSEREQAEQLVQQLRQNAQALAAAASHALPYDIDSDLSPHLEKLAQQLEQAAEQLKRKLERLDLDRPGLDLELSALAGMLGKQSDLHNEQAVSPLERLERVVPLMADQARFTALVQQQRDLAERIAPLTALDGEDSPALKARMRDLQDEQYAIRQQLDSLLSDIEDHVQQLPEDPEYDELRNTATEFAAAVRKSGAAEEMAQAETGLAEFSGTLAHKHALRAAEILEQFLSQCQGMGTAAGNCLVFSPGFGGSSAQSLGQTAAQLLAEMGLGSGQGSGGGSGYSASRNSMNNMGLYGGMPALLGADGGAGRSTSEKAQTARDAAAGPGGDNPDQSTFAELASPELEGGSSASGVPLHYRRRVGEYFRKLSEELDTYR